MALLSLIVLLALATGTWAVGCRCRADKGFVRSGRLSPLSPCIKAKDCPKKETPPPECPQNTVFRKCGSCEGTCLQPHPACTAECRKPGCYCPADQGYVRSSRDGGCIPYWQCQRRPARQPTAQDLEFKNATILI
uniref:TIL domain-containing protein n=1 Tax=Steinernema glaseri TaxID=37863 RepID=A0A1I7ZQW4_9BILA